MPPTPMNNALISPMLHQQVPTDATTPTPLRNSDDKAEKYRAEWQKIIDYKLIEWGLAPEELQDDGIEPPSREIIHLAIQLAAKFAEGGLSSPDSVVPDANGGIVFELRHEGMSEVIHIWGDGQAEYQRFEGTSLVERRNMQF